MDGQANIMNHNHNPLSHHSESNAILSASPDRVFALIDDHERLAAHMSQPSWRMGGGSMKTALDAGRGQSVGSHIRMTGRILGIGLSLDEVVTEREPPSRKVWETVGNPILLVIGPHRMGFEVMPHQNGSLLRVFIEYALPTHWSAHLLGRIFGGYYAYWCTQSMVDDALRHFAPRAKPAAIGVE